MAPQRQHQHTGLVATLCSLWWMGWWLTLQFSSNNIWWRFNLKIERISWSINCIKQASRAKIVPVFEKVEVSPDGCRCIKDKISAALLVSGVGQIWVRVLCWFLWFWFRWRCRPWCWCGPCCTAAWKIWTLTVLNHLMWFEFISGFQMHG